MGDKPVSLQESYPEICDTLKENFNKNVEVKSESSNKTSKPSKVSYELCQILQDTCAPHKVTVVKETFSKQCKQSSCDPMEKSKRFIYCKEVVKPYIKPDCSKSPEDLAYCALELIGTEFPKFKYCCCNQSPESPKVKIECCIKKVKKCKKPVCNVQHECEPECDYCDKAKECLKDLCLATRNAMNKFNDMCNSNTCQKDEELPPPPHPNCSKKPKECSMEFPKTVTMIFVENPQVKSNPETQPKHTFMDRAVDATKYAVETVADTKHYLTKFYSIHSLLLLPLDEIEKQEEEEPQNVLMEQQQSIIDEAARQRDDQERDLKEEQEEEEKLKQNPLDNLVRVSNNTTHKMLKIPKLISLTYIEDDHDDCDDENEVVPVFTESEKYPLEDLNDVDEDDEQDTFIFSKRTRPSFISGLVNKVIKTINPPPTADTEGKDVLDRLGETFMNALGTTANTTVTTFETVTTASANLVGKVYNDATTLVSDAVFGFDENEESIKGQVFSTSSETDETNFSDSVVSRVMNIFTNDKGSIYDVPTPEDVSVIAQTPNEVNEVGIFTKIKSKFYSIFHDGSK